MSDIVAGYTFATAEKNITATKLNNVVGLATIDPNFYASKPTASTVNPTDQLLILSSGAYAQAPFSTIVNAVGNSMGPQITAVRLRSFNAVGNPTFEVDQRNAGAALTNVANASWLQDRYLLGKVGTMTINGGQNAALVLLPGTSFTISRCFQRITLTGQEGSLGASDYLMITHSVEGPYFRELISDVHSISLLVRSSVAGLKFGCTIGDAGAPTTSLTNLCTIPTANTWTLIQLPNLPVFPAGNFSTGPGLCNQFMRIVLAAGASATAPANGVWGGVFNGALGQDNFAAKPVNSTFDIAFIQWEPGSQCTTLIDKPFTRNYDECLRYFQMSYDYRTAIGTTNVLAGIVGAYASSATLLMNMGHRFKKPMAKAPTVTPYNHSTGAPSSVQDWAGAAHAITTVNNPSTESPFWGLTTTGLTVGQGGWVHYSADTGW